MDTNFLSGTGVALVTPFDQHNQVDYLALEKLVNYVISGGVEYLVVMGTTGESAVISTEEKQIVIRRILEFNRARVPVVLGIGGNDTTAVTKAIASQDFTGIDGLLSVSPYYNKPSQEGIFEHFKLVAKTAPVPVIIYNVPGRTASMISSRTTLQLAAIDNIVATKEASGDFSSIMQIIAHKPDDFLVISGDDALTMPLIAIGAAGVISVVANTAPFEMSELVRKCLLNQFDVARELHYKLLPLIDLVFAEGSPAGVKAALYLKGIIQNYLRMPLLPASEILTKQMAERLRLLNHDIV